LVAAASAAAFALFAGHASAAVVYEQAFDPHGVGGGYSASGGQRWAEYVTLADAATIDQVTWYGSSYSDQDFDFAPFDINVWADDGSGNPGTLLHHRTGDATATATDQRDGYNDKVFKFSLDVTPFALSGGTQYHVGISDQGGYNFIWDTATKSCCSLITYNGESWGQYSYTHAFALISNGGSGAPEPAAWTMMIGGFGMAGAMLRHRRRRPMGAVG